MYSSVLMCRCIHLFEFHNGCLLFKIQYKVVLCNSHYIWPLEAKYFVIESYVQMFKSSHKLWKDLKKQQIQIDEYIYTWVQMSTFTRTLINKSFYKIHDNEIESWTAQFYLILNIIKEFHLHYQFRRNEISFHTRCKT
jgi:hypothetical protein